MNFTMMACGNLCADYYDLDGEHCTVEIDEKGETHIGFYAHRKMRFRSDDLATIARYASDAVLDEWNRRACRGLPKWVDATERLPDKSGYYHVLLKGATEPSQDFFGRSFNVPQWARVEWWLELSLPAHPT